MNGLSKINATQLEKQAGEGSLENNMKQLITDEAYNQIASKFPKLVPLIVGVNIIEMVDDVTAIGAAVLGVEGKKLLIPVIYSGGDVNATTFIYSEDEDTILALTKKVVSVLVASSSVLEGGVPEQKGGQNFDIGDIHRLFVPPKTFSPKIASGAGGLLFAVLEQSPLLKTALAKKLENSEYKKEFSAYYGEEATDSILSNNMEKTASEHDDSPSEVLFDKKSIMESSWLNKKAAMKEFAMNGFAISQGISTPKKSLEKVASIATKLKEISGEEALTTIDGRRPGVYTVYQASDLKPIDMVIAHNINSSQKDSPTVIYGPEVSFLNAGVINGNGVIGNQKNLSDTNAFDPFESIWKNMDSSIKLVIIDGGEIYGFTSIYLNGDRIEKGLGRTAISLGMGSAVETIIVDKDSDAKPVKMGSTLYVGSNNIKLIKEDSKDSSAVIKTSDLGSNFIGGNIVKVNSDGVEFIYKSAAYSTPALVNELLNEGFDKASIYNLIKTAANDGSAELMAVNAKLDMLANLVMNLAGQVQQNTTQQAQSQQGGLGGIPTDVIPAQAPQEQQQGGGQPQEAVLAMPDTNTGIPSQEQMAMQAGEQAQVVQADQQFLGQNQPEQLDTSGMNTEIDPAILKTLAELKDSNVMDVGIISMIAASSEIGDVVGQYSGAIHSGASAIGRILLNAMVKKNSIIEQVGEPKYKQMINSLKTVFTKISDLYVDVTRLRLESDGQVAN